VTRDGDAAEQALGTAQVVLGRAEDALAAGRPEEAANVLAQAGEAPIDDTLLPRWLDTLARANRFLSRHRETVSWIEKRLADSPSPGARVQLLRARVGALRQFDPHAALELVNDALAAAREAGDLPAIASVLSHASFCAYRRGDARLAAQFAEQAEKLAFPTPRAQIDGLRAQLFAATAAGAIERALELSTILRDRHLVVGDVAGAANECNNRAEELQRLGRPEDALASALEAQKLAASSGHRGVAAFAEVLGAAAICESGRLDEGIAALERALQAPDNLIFELDTAAAHAFWRVERRVADDARHAAAISAGALARASSAGVSHLLTKLHATRARALALLGLAFEARAELESARQLANVADIESELHLALTMAEILPAGEPAREVSVRAARTRLLLAAARREDPRRYCTNVRLHRRLLELSGGVPDDLPDAMGQK
jgi:tetratricopeptide (TPR) repeat protein